MFSEFSCIYLSGETENKRIMSLKERIIDHTTTMFARNGVKSVRMDDIATDMGISKRTIYETFGDKENLIMECLRHFHEKIKKNNQEITTKATNIIEEYLMMLEVWDKQLDATYNMMGDIKKFYPKIYDKYNKEHSIQAAALIRKKLQAGIDQGYLLSDININLSISIVGYSIYGIINKDTIVPHNVSERDAFKYVISYFIRGIATLKGIKLIDEYFENNKS